MEHRVLARYDSFAIVRFTMRDGKTHHPCSKKGWRPAKQAISLLAVISLLWLAACNEGNKGAPQWLGNPTSSDSQTTSPQTSNTNNSPTTPPATTVQKLVYDIGPVNLPPGTTSVQLTKALKSLEEAMWITGFEPKVLDRNSKPLPGQLLQLGVLTNHNEDNPFCHKGNGGNAFAAATSTLTKVTLPPGYGYPLLPQDPLKAKVIFQNPTNEPYHDVYFTVELTGTPLAEASDMIDVRPLLLDVDPCDHKPLQIAPTDYVEQAKAFTVPANGTLIVAHGVLQNFAVSVSLTRTSPKNPELLPFWKAIARLDENHHIIDLDDDPYEDPAGKALKAGDDELTLGVAYDNPSDRWFNGATAAAMVYLARSEE